MIFMLPKQQKHLNNNENTKVSKSCKEILTSIWYVFSYIMNLTAHYKCRAIIEKHHCTGLYRM